MRTSIAFLLLSGFALSAPAQDLPPEVLLLARVKSHLAAVMARLPNYTCIETLQRFRRPAGSAEPKPVDVIRFEVLYSGDRELFSRPGSRQFDVSSPSSFAAGGLTGNGTFATSLKAIFLNGHAIITYGGEEELRGRRTARYDYALASHLSGYTVDVNGMDAPAGMKGSAWVDPQSFDVLRLDVRGYDIPASLGVKEIATTVNYARASIGGEEMMAPEDGETRMVMATGEEARNAFEFTQCRIFHAESNIMFDGVPDVSSRFLLDGIGERMSPPPLQPALPAGLAITIALSAPLTSGQTPGGAVEGRVAGSVTAGGKTLIPDGSIVRGRMRRMERHMESAGSFAVSLEFTDIEIAGRFTRFFANIAEMDPLPSLEWDRSVSAKLPGVVSFLIHGDSFELPKGFKTVWRTLPQGK